jgi:hypothetical protein
MPDLYQPSHPPKGRPISLSSLVLVPLKQHFGCCVLLPAMVKTLGSASILGAFLLYPRFHLYLALGLAPLVVWLCLVLEDRYHTRQHNKGHFAAGHAHHHQY